MSEGNLDRRTVITRLASGLLAAGTLPVIGLSLKPQSPFLTQAEMPSPVFSAAASPVESTATPIIFQASVFASSPYANPEATSCAGVVSINPDRIPTQNGFLEKNVLVSASAPNGQIYYLERLNRAPGEMEIQDAFSPKRVKFSKTIIDGGLVPAVIDSSKSIAEHHQEADNYLLKLTAFLENNLALLGPTMGELGVVNEQNCHIDLMPHFRFVDVLHSYFHSLNNTLRFTSNPSLNSSFTLAHFPSALWQDERFVTIGRVQTSVDILKDTRRNEEGNQTYYHYTDAQLGAKKIHEFVHHLQFRGSMQEVLRDERKAEIIGKDRDELYRWIEREEEAKKKQFQDSLVGSDYKLKDAVRYSPNEAQANLIAQLMIRMLKLANGTDRFPGFGDDDAFNTRGTLFQIYETFVLPQNGREGNPMHPDWLNMHKDWPQIR